MFDIEFTTQSRKFLKKCDKDLAIRIMKKIEVLSSDPIIHDSKKVVGEDNTFRVRIGDYRVLYEVKSSANKVLIHKIDKRSKVYSA